MPCFSRLFGSCVLQSFLYALIATIIFLSIHFYFIESRINEIKLILLISTLGFTFDYFLKSIGFIKLSDDDNFPFYLLCLWVAFTATLSSSCKFLMADIKFAVIGGIIAPCSYIGAQKLGKVS